MKKRDAHFLLQDSDNLENRTHYAVVYSNLLHFTNDIIQKKESRTTLWKQGDGPKKESTTPSNED